MPLAPLANATEEPDTCAEACASLPLYVSATRAASGSPTARGMSSLPGDAMPGEPTTQESSVLRARTEPIEGIQLAREDTFRVDLVSSQSFQYVNGTITVQAIDAAGGQVTLGRVAFERPPAPSAQDIAVGAFAATDLARTIEPVSRAISGQATDRVEQGFESLGSNPLRAATDLAFTGASGLPGVCGTTPTTYNNPWCRVVTGRPLTGGHLAMCEGPTLNPTFNLLWSTVAQVDNTLYSSPAGRKAVCWDYYTQDVNQTADDHGASVGAVVEPMPSTFEATWATVQASMNVSATNVTPAHQWRNVTIDAVLPPHFPTSGDLFTLPPGYRLSLEVDLDGLVLTPRGYERVPIVFSLGRADAPTALVIRHATPGSFARFAQDVAPILPGQHSASFATLTDARDYAFTAAAGEIVNLTQFAGGRIMLTLFDADGRATASTNGRLRVPATAGLWTLRVTAADPTGYPTDFVFRLALDVPNGEADEGIFLEQGWANGALGAGDDSDTYTVFGWKAQRFSFTALFPADAAYRLEVSGVGLWSVATDSGPGFQTLGGRLSETGTFTLRIVRAYGQGAYDLGVWPDAAGNLTFVPTFDTVLTPQTDDVYHQLFGFDSGVYFSNETSLFRYHPSTGVTLERGTPERAQGMTAQGALVRSMKTSGTAAMSIDALGATNPLVRSGEAAFAPDGLYGITFAGRVYRMLEDRTVELFGSGHQGGAVVVTPDGQAHLVHETQTFRIDAAQGALVPAARLDGVRAFDVYGAQYRILNGTLVERTEPWSDHSQIVAQAPHLIAELVAAGPYLYARVEGELPAPSTIALVGAPTWGFDGFEPSFAPAAAPELRVVDVREVEVNTSIVPLSQSRTFRVTLANDGGAPTGSFGVTLEVGQGPSPYRTVARAPSIAPGEQATVEMTWPQNLTVGDRQARIWVDPAFEMDEVVELNENNNIVHFLTHAWIGGNDAICRSAVGELADVAPSPHPVLGGAELGNAVCRSLRE